MAPTVVTASSTAQRGTRRYFTGSSPGEASSSARASARLTATAMYMAVSMPTHGMMTKPVSSDPRIEPTVLTVYTELVSWPTLSRCVA